MAALVTSMAHSLFQTALRLPRHPALCHPVLQPLLVPAPLRCLTQQPQTSTPLLLFRVLRHPCRRLPLPFIPPASLSALVALAPLAMVLLRQARPAVAALPLPHQMVQPPPALLAQPHSPEQLQPTRSASASRPLASSPPTSYKFAAGT